jgi:hypothetical protein
VILIKPVGRYIGILTVAEVDSSRKHGGHSIGRKGEHAAGHITSFFLTISSIIGLSTCER